MLANSAAWQAVLLATLAAPGCGPTGFVPLPEEFAGRVWAVDPQPLVPGAFPGEDCDLGCVQCFYVIEENTTGGNFTTLLSNADGSTALAGGTWELETSGGAPRIALHRVNQNEQSLEIRPPRAENEDYRFRSRTRNFSVWAPCPVAPENRPALLDEVDWSAPGGG